MGLLRRVLGPAFDSTPSESVEKDGHVHAPDAEPDDVVLPKTKRSSRSLIAGKPPLGWQRQASDASGGVLPWSGDDSDGGHHLGGSGDGDGSSSAGSD